MSFTVTQLRRYPIKSMGGEDLGFAGLDSRGIVGDRWFAVRDNEGHLASGKNTRRFRRRDPVFEYEARTTEKGVEVTREGQRWMVGDSSLDTDLSHRMGLSVTVAAEGAVPHQDMASTSLVGSATLKWCAERWGINPDPRRLRVNCVIETDEPFIEESWVGQTLHVGAASLAVLRRVPRCRMIDIDQDGAVADGKWLKPLAQERDMSICIYADIVQPGRVQVGDGVQVA